MYFKDIIGQQEIKKKLINQVREDRIAHAQLLYGPEGTGKLLLAIAYARYISCTNKGENDACGKCPSCIKFNKLVHPDTHFAFPIVKKGSAKKSICNDYIEEWREMILENNYFNINHWLNKLEAENSQAMIYAKESDEIIKSLSYKSSEGGYKVMIIWLPERMNIECANKILKLLEEPPKQTLFLLVADNTDNIIQTIQSRTQKIYIPRIEKDEIQEALEKRYQIDKEQSSSIAHYANGNFIKALECIHIDEEKKMFFDAFVNLMRLAYQRKIKEIKNWSEMVASLGREKQKHFLAYAQQMVRENFIFNLREQELNYLGLQEQQFAKNFARFINETNVFDMMNEIEEAQKHIEQNVNAKMVFFDFGLKAIVLLKH